MNIWVLISLVVAAISFLFSATRQFQMLQQNSYFPKRYGKWLKNNLPLEDVIFFFISSLIFKFKWYPVLTVFTVLLLTFRAWRAVSIQKNSIKKLVFTGRIIRLFSASVILQVGLIVLSLVNYSLLMGRLLLVISFTFSYLTPITVLVAWCLTFPIEKGFSAWYINDAKRILRKHNGIKVIGITGSYGKTSEKFILTRILSEKFNVVCTPQSFNTPMGVVRTVRSDLKPQTEIFICEMGAKKTGDIKEICDIVSPDVALITSVGEQHLETFKTVDNVFSTKFELAKAVTKKGGKIFINGDSDEIRKRVSLGEYFIYGSDSSYNAVISDIVSDRTGSKFTVKIGEKTVDLSTKLLGKHNIQNIAGAVSVALDLGVETDDISFAVSSLKPYEHRLELKNSVNGSLLIDDAYNANPEGCIEAVNVLSSFEGMTKVIITPGLIELGEKEYECNYKLGVAAGEKCDIIILVGPNHSKPIADGVLSTGFPKENLHTVSSFKEGMDIFSKLADEKSVVLLENDLPDNYLN